MEVGAAVAGVAAGAQALFGYNRENFKYDREMRQKSEYQVLGWRGRQAELWRDDVREIIGLTEKKMDNYLIISTLQLGMCVGLFTEGRLAPGTPPWLLNLYMLTLGAAFLYLLMAVWFAMHASVVAQCSSVRLLTQFIRLPVPTWRQLEEMRTYAESFENLRAKHILRVPFVQDARGPRAGLQSQSGSSASAIEDPGPAATSDPWESEAHGHHRRLYELQHMPAAMRHHVKLARRASQQFQCFDAFARVAMTFGTNQLLQAITYYCLGYVGVQDGAPWPAFCIAGIMVAISMTMVHLDLSLTSKEQLTGKILTMTGPLCASIVSWMQAVDGLRSDHLVMTLLPIASAAHGLWLLWALWICGVQQQKNGSMLPVKFRAVLYLDVFGWLSKGNVVSATSSDDAYTAMHPTSGDEYAPDFEGSRDLEMAESSDRSISDLERDLHEHIALWRSDKVQSMMDDHAKARVESIAMRFQEAALSSTYAPTGTSAESRAAGTGSPPQRQWVKLHGYCDLGTETQYLFDPETGAVAHEVEAASADNHHVRSLTFAEADVDKYCAHMSSQPGSQQGTGGRVPGPTLDDGRHSKPRHQASVFPAPGNKKTVTDHLGEALSCTVVRTTSSSFSDDASSKPCDDAANLPHIVESVGPAGTVPSAPPHVFTPSSFLPDPSAGRMLDGSEEVVTGHDRMNPGQLPWKIFRGATLLLVTLWALGMAGPLGLFQGLVLKPILLHGEEVILSEPEASRGPVEGAELRSSPLEGLLPELNLPSLPKGEVVQAAWPSHSGFVPIALSSDPFGKQLVVADDFGVYSGTLETNQVTSRPQLLPTTGRRLGEDRVNITVNVLTARFHRMAPCAALEGQALKDIDVACSGKDLPTSACQVFVLHAQGRRLAECPLPTPGLSSPTEMSRNTGAAVPRKAQAISRDRAQRKAMQPNITWSISSDWLYSHEGNRSQEYVESVAVNSKCLAIAGHSKRKGGSSNSGCVVVGTSSGRIVQLRRHMIDGKRLVPEKAVQAKSEAVNQGELHVFPSGFLVALRRQTNSVEAFDARSGTAIGEWRLPGGIAWMKLTGGGDSLFVLGKNRTDVHLYRFPVPAALRRRRRQVVGGLAVGIDSTHSQASFEM